MTICLDLQRSHRNRSSQQAQHIAEPHQRCDRWRGFVVFHIAQKAFGNADRLRGGRQSQIETTALLAKQVADFQGLTA